MGHAGPAHDADPALPELIILLGMTSRPLPETEAAVVVCGGRRYPPDMANIQIELSDQSAEFIHAKVRSGEFRDADEVIATAILAYKERIEAFNREAQIGLDAVARGDTIRVDDVQAFLAERRESRQAT